MKKIAICIILAGLSAFCAKGQNIVVPEGYVLADSLVFAPALQVDSTLIGGDIFSIISVDQPRDLRNAFGNYLTGNPDRKVTGYRVRIFFDNKQSARGDSEAAVKKFSASHPGVPTYRSYESPYFKVTVGDFRTRSEAMQLLQSVKNDFPGAFIVKGDIRFPMLGETTAYVVDTVYVLRREK